ncbi:MAG TPA: RNA methyltransferase [Ferruginibacter sp.]|nr:RNA methyltransferase [Ferruginibacter sp.]
MSLPIAFLQSIQNIPGFTEEAFINAHEQEQPITSIRLNPKKLKIQDSNFEIDEQVQWSTNGYYLKERPSFTLDPLFHAGAYYVQEASSMFLEQVIKQTAELTKPLKVLDLCAAPGGKSTLIQSILSADSLLISNEVIKTRVTILSENISKWGAANVIVTNNDPKDFEKLQDYFDMIIVDAPCSGSGLFRKDINAINEWSEDNVTLCAQRQQRILANILPSLKVDGILIYSTCSYSKQEDEDILDWILDECFLENEEPTLKSLHVKLDEKWGIIETVSEKNKAFGYRFYPDKVKGEGFFIAAFQKREPIENRNQHIKKHIKNKKEIEKLSLKEIEILKPYLINSSNFFFFRQNEEVIALPTQFENDLTIIQSALYIKKAGVKLGTIIRNELIPLHELAVSNIINPLINKLEVDKETALQYLRKQQIKIDLNGKGWLLLTYNNLPLGWVKVIGNRINNYYPAVWRILNK